MSSEKIECLNCHKKVKKSEAFEKDKDFCSFECAKSFYDFLANFMERTNVFEKARKRVEERDKK